MAPMALRSWNFGRSGKITLIILAFATISVLALAKILSPCICSSDNHAHNRPADRKPEMGVLGAQGRFGSRAATYNVWSSQSTDISQDEQIFEDLKPEKNEALSQTEYEEDPGRLDIMSNLSLADIKHMTWGETLDVEAFVAWAQRHVASKATTNFVLPELLIKAENLCSSETELLVLMPSVPEHVFVRELVRQTWAGSLYGMPWPRRRLHLRTKLVFVLGTDGLAENKIDLLKEESQEYGDLVTASFVDTYRNLTLKMITGLSWVTRHCPSASYILKCDLDTFVNLPLLTRLLVSVGEKLPRFVFGARHEAPNPPVMRSGRWSISLEEYPFPVFPPYVMGHSYVLTADLAPQMVRLAHKIPIVPSEDSFITGVLACILKATRLHHEAFATNFKRHLPCNILFNEDVSMTKMGMSHLLLMWRHVLTNSCSAKELISRANMVTGNQQGKKKQQQPSILNQDQVENQQPRQNLPNTMQEEQLGKAWKNDNVNQHQQNQESQPLQWQLQPKNQPGMILNEKRQQYPKHYEQDKWESPWQVPKVGSIVNVQEQEKKLQYPYPKKLKQNQIENTGQHGNENEVDKREQLLIEQENKFLQQLFQ